MNEREQERNVAWEDANLAWCALPEEERDGIRDGTRHNAYIAGWLACARSRAGAGEPVAWLIEDEHGTMDRVCLPEDHAQTVVKRLSRNGAKWTAVPLYRYAHPAPVEPAKPVPIVFQQESVFCLYCGKPPQQHLGDCRNQIRGITT